MKFEMKILFFETIKMTYQSFASVNELNHTDPGFMRDFRIIIPKGKYITQDDIYFDIEYTNINYDKIEDSFVNLLTKNQSLGFKKDLDSLKEYKTKINELIDSTIGTIEQEYKEAPSRQTPLFIFQNIEMFVDERSVARRMFSSLDELIVDGCLYLNQIFPGIKFKYDSNNFIMIKFTRGVIKDKCLKFECHYNLNDVPENETFENVLSKKYKEYLLPAGLYSANIDIEPDVKTFKMVPCVRHTLFKIIENKDYKAEAERIIKNNYDILKFKYYKDGQEIQESEFGTSPGLYHIEIFNKDEIKNKDDFYKIDYKFICLC